MYRAEVYLYNLLFLIECPDIGIDYYGSDVEKKTGVSTWGACAKLCREKEGCYLWSWMDTTYSDVAGHYNCHLKSLHALAGRKKLNGLTSGTKDCTPHCKYFMYIYK